MRYISERDMIKDGIKAFIAEYSYNRFEGWKKTADVLKKIDPDVVSKQEVDSIIGNNTWTQHRCSECGSYYSEIFILGEEPEYEFNIAYLCKDCMQKAVNLFNSVEK